MNTRYLPVLQSPDVSAKTPHSLPAPAPCPPVAARNRPCPLRRACSRAHPEKDCPSTRRLRSNRRFREVRLQDGDGAVLDHAVELEAGVVVLARRKRYQAEAFRLDVAEIIVGRERLS